MSERQSHQIPTYRRKRFRQPRRAMTEEVNENVNEEVVHPTETGEEPSDVSQEVSQAEHQKRKDAEHNWSEMRRQMREKDHEIQELKRQFSSFNKKPSDDEDELSRLAEDDIITVAQSKKLAQKMARQIAEDVLRQREASTAEERAQLKYPDFNEIVTKENIDLLNRTEPELAESLYNMPDKYKQAVAAYKLLKKLNSKDSGALEKKKALENSQKPVSVNAVTKNSPIGNAHLFENGLTKDLKQQLWKEMQQAMKTG